MPIDAKNDKRSGLMPRTTGGGCAPSGSGQVPPWGSAVLLETMPSDADRHNDGLSDRPASLASRTRA
ncbi:hypothetical protein [Arthrobacter sp. HLT1-21]